MRKVLWLAVVTSIAAGGGVYWYGGAIKPAARVAVQHTCSCEGTLPNPQSTDPTPEAAIYDAIEPLLVEGAAPLYPTQPAPGYFEDTNGRVELASGVQQPPRPDAEPGNTLRMPYADETAIAATVGNPLRGFVVAVLSRLNVFESADGDNPAEESEAAEKVPDAEPMPNYHRDHQHCPYSGAYYNPYRR